MADLRASFMGSVIPCWQDTMRFSFCDHLTAMMRLVRKRGACMRSNLGVTSLENSSIRSLPESDLRRSIAGHRGGEMCNSVTLVPFVVGRRTKDFLVSAARQSCGLTGSATRRSGLMGSATRCLRASIFSPSIAAQPLSHER